MNEITERTIEDYKKYLIEEEKSSVTIEKYIRDINAFAEWSDGREITKTLVLEYKNILVRYIVTIAYLIAYFTIAKKK